MLALCWPRRWELAESCTGTGRCRKPSKNFFAQGITIVGQKALRVGDFCKIGDDMGTVEDIGLSSLKLRMGDRCVVTLPNSKVVQQSIQNFSSRDKFLVQKTFSLRQDTTSEQVSKVQSQIEQLLQETREVERGSPRVRLIDLSPSGLRMEIWAYLLLPPADTLPDALRPSENALRRGAEGP